MPLAKLANGVDLFYDERGEGVPLVLIMGIGCQMVWWPEGFCDELAARGFRVIRFDHRDIGCSTKLDHLGVPPLVPTLMAGLLGRSLSAPYSLADMADDVAGLLDYLEIDSAHITGASMGGMIAQTMAFTHPHRVRSLVSIMSTTGESGHYMSEFGALKKLLGPPPRSREEAIERSVDVWKAIGSTGFEFDREGVAYRAGLAFDRGNHPKGFLRHLGAIAMTGDRTARLRFVRAPTLVIHGTADPLIRPLGGELTHRAIGGSRLEMVEGMGHDVPHELWPHFAEMIRDNANRLRS